MLGTVFNHNSIAKNNIMPVLVSWILETAMIFFCGVKLKKAIIISLPSY